ncbi:MAG: glycosyltransferase 87 family protein, partial [Actinomycetota bacterium]|nr:glycosyltransferase 87 family protein [Actinomycetota bacterium]
MALFSLAWALLQAGFPGSREIVDTPLYQAYGNAVLDGRVPYRDFELEYPPGALPVFILPSLGEDGQYEDLFAGLMLLCGATAVALVAAALAALGASSRRLYGGVALAALAPLLLGPVVLTRFDFWPAALTVGSLVSLVAGRARVGLGLLAAGVAAKIYPLVLLPLALVYVWRRRGRSEALTALAVFALVLAAAFLPFALVAPDGLLESLERQARRPLQIESLGAAVLLAAHRLGLYDAVVVSSHGSQNLVGALPEALATAQTAVQAVAVAGVWLLFALRTPERERLVVASAAAVAALVAFGKVLSPQFLVWLVPLVPLATRRAGLVAAGILTAALVVTQLWFPSRYWDVVALLPVSWLVLLRDVLLVALACILVAAI